MRSNKFSRDLLRGMEEAVDYVEGRRNTGVRVHSVDVPDVKRIRLGLHMSQSGFATAFDIPLPTLKNWEQGRRAPDAPAAAYLRVISRQPAAVQEAHRGMRAAARKTAAVTTSRKKTTASRKRPSS